MNCSQARILLDQGIRPGSTPPQRASLGFHLAGCAECQAYLASLQDDLLSALLAQSGGAQRPAPVVAPPPPAPVDATPPPSARRPHQALGWVLRYAGIALIAMVALLVASVVASAALSAFNIHRNVQAMIVPTAAASALPETATPEPTALPSHTPLPTSTPRPTSTPKPTVPPPTPTPAPPPSGGPITVLLLGSDRRPGETGPPRTDAIIVAHIDPQHGRVALLSLPRDLWVEIPGYGAARINAAHVWGITYNDPESGMGLARRTVSNLLGIPVDNTMLVDFEGFIGAIDALGGVEVDVPKELYDASFPTMDYGYTVAHFLPGTQHMDGATALMYSRIRHPDSDFARMRRQQAVLVGVLSHLRVQNALASLKSLEDLTTALRGYVQTDIPEDRLIGLAWALRNLDPANVEHYVLDENMVSFGIGADQYAEVAIPGSVEALAQQLTGSP
jgi:LCP family protein required for cell wall assembly